MVVTLLVMVIIVSLMVGFNALFVAGEFSAVSARKARIAQAAKAGNRLAQRLLPVLEDPKRLDNYIAASQVGITLSSIVLGIYGQRQVAPLIEPLLIRLPFLNGEAAATAVSAIIILILFTTLQVVLGELVPKSLALQYPERVAMSTVVPMRLSADLILRPLIVVLNGSGAFLMRLLRLGHGGAHQHVHSPEEIQLLIRQSYKGGLLDSRGQELLNNAFRISDLEVAGVAIPRTEIAAISVETVARDALRFAVDSRHTRIPVYEESIDRIVGFVHIKDLFPFYKATAGQGSVRQIVRKVTFVAQTTPVKEVWNQLKVERNYLAIVLDEYGGTMGMVTWEDLLEELFGELYDEFDEAEEPLIARAGKQEYVIRGETPVSYLNSRFELALPVERVYSVGGLMMSQLNRFPEPGDVVEIDGIQMHAETVSDRAVETIMLRLPSEVADREGIS